MLKTSFFTQCSVADEVRVTFLHKVFVASVLESKEKITANIALEELAQCLEICKKPGINRLSFLIGFSASIDEQFEPFSNPMNWTSELSNIWGNNENINKAIEYYTNLKAVISAKIHLHTKGKGTTSKPIIRPISKQPSTFGAEVNLDSMNGSGFQASSISEPSWMLPGTEHFVNIVHRGRFLFYQGECVLSEEEALDESVSGEEETPDDIQNMSLDEIKPKLCKLLRKFLSTVDLIGHRDPKDIAINELRRCVYLCKEAPLSSECAGEVLQILINNGSVFFKDPNYDWDVATIIKWSNHPFTTEALEKVKELSSILRNKQSKEEVSNGVENHQALQSSFS